MNPRFLVAAIALLLIGGVIAVGERFGGGKRPAVSPSPPPVVRSSPSGPNCAQLPARVAEPGWLPADLPLPPGSYATGLIPPAGTKRATWAVKASLTDFVRWVIREWRDRRGWFLGRGDAEPGEADDSFRSKDGRRIGAFKARSVYCDENWTLVLIVLTEASPSPSG